jgi:hypothetical protein
MFRVAPRSHNGDGYIHHRVASGRLELECDTASVGHPAYRSPQLLLSFWSGRFGWVEPPLARDATTKLTVRPEELVEATRQCVRAAWEDRLPLK